MLTKLPYDFPTLPDDWPAGQCVLSGYDTYSMTVRVGTGKYRGAINAKIG
jgi:hypothetical protein